MVRKSHDCIPSQEGYYFATYASTGYRHLVELGRDGNKHLRVYVMRWSASRNPNDFKDWSGRIKVK